MEVPHNPTGPETPENVEANPTEQVFTTFYTPAVRSELQRRTTFDYQDAVFYHPPLDQRLKAFNKATLWIDFEDRAKEDYLTDAYSLIKNLPVHDVMDSYWKLHNEAYQRRIDAMVSQVPEGFIKGDEKAVVVMAAMNELEIDEALAHLEDSYGEAFTEEVKVVLYHNFKQAPDADVQAAVAKVKERNNIAVVEEQVAQNSNVGMAKKVASDVAQKLIPANIDIPLVLTDADTKGYSPEVVQEGLKLLENPFILAASPEYDFDSTAKIKFPVLGFLWDVSRKMRESNDKHSTKSTIGPLTVIDRKTLAAVGGIKVVKQRGDTLLPVPYEDMHLSFDLESVLDYFQTRDAQKRHPVAKIPGVVEMDCSREILDLLKGNAANARWQNHEYSKEISGTKRFAWQTVEPTDAIPALGSFTPDNAAQVLNTYWTGNLFNFVQDGANGANTSRALLDTVKNLGFDYDIQILRNVVTEGDTTQREYITGAEALERLNQEEGWRIDKFTSITPLK